MTLLKNTLLAAILLLVSDTALFGQYKVRSSATISIVVNDLPSVEKKVDELIGQNNLKPGKYNKSRYEIDLTLYVDQSLYDKVLSAAQTWGYVSSQNVTQTTYDAEMDKLRADIAALETEKAEYLSLADYADSTQKGNYFIYKEKMIELEKAIRQNRQKLNEYESGKTIHYIDITVREESNATMEYSSTWVNMPGIEYSCLWVEQPNPGVTPDAMQGISLKYLFNTGKSYGILGLYKNYGAPTKVNEAYTFAFGQDFYSRRMGRGQRRFFNLYTSFNAGVYILTGEDSRSASWFVNPYLGLELFKNKYFLIDNKVGYFLPYRDNRDLRGLLYNVSFNFVF